MKAPSFLRRDSGVLSLGSVLVIDHFVFLKSCGFPELDFLSPMHAPPLRNGTLYLMRELSLPPLSPFEDSLGADRLSLWVVGVGGKSRRARKLLKASQLNTIVHMQRFLAELFQVST